MKIILNISECDKVGNGYRFIISLWFIFDRWNNHKTQDYRRICEWIQYRFSSNMTNQTDERERSLLQRISSSTKKLMNISIFRVFFFKIRLIAHFSIITARDFAFVLKISISIE